SEEGAGRGGAGAGAGCAGGGDSGCEWTAADERGCGRAAMGGQRLDGVQQQREGGSALRAVFHGPARRLGGGGKRGGRGVLLRPGGAAHRHVTPESHLGKSCV